MATSALYEKNRRRGFSVTESLFAAILLILLLGAALELGPRFFVRTYESEQRIQAKALAFTLLEEYRGQAFAVSLGSQSTPPEVIDGVTYNRECNISAVRSYSTDKIREISVQVSWQYKSIQREELVKTWVSYAD